MALRRSALNQITHDGLVCSERIHRLMNQPSYYSGSDTWSNTASLDAIGRRDEGSDWTTNCPSRLTSKCALDFKTILLPVVVSLALTSGIACEGGAAGTPASMIDPPPHIVEYTTVYQWPVPNGGYTRNVVIADTAANEAGLRALGEELRYDTRSDRNAFVLVFSSARAAKMWRAVVDESASKRDLAYYDRHFVASYTRNINTGYHHYTIMAKGINGPQEDIDY